MTNTVEQDANKSEFVKARDSFERWIEHLWGTKGVKTVVATTEDAALTAGKAVLVGSAIQGMAAHAQGGNFVTVRNAAEKGAMDAVATVGVQVGTETVQKIVEVVSNSINPTEQDAPPPPTE